VALVHAPISPKPAAGDRLGAGSATVLSMLRASAAFLKSRPWTVISIACALFALYEGATKILGGHAVEGISDLILFAVFLVNFVNRFKIIGGYVKQLREQDGS
jgi:hypothetical protein